MPVALSHIFSFTVYARAWWSAFMHPAGLSTFYKCTSTSLFTGSTFSLKMNIFHEYPIQYVAKSIATCKKNPYIINQKPYFFWIDFNKSYTKTFRIVYILTVYLLIMFIGVVFICK
jgi:hypothetical protein